MLYRSLMLENLKNYARQTDISVLGPPRDQPLMTLLILMTQVEETARCAPWAKETRNAAISIAETWIKNTPMTSNMIYITIDIKTIDGSR